MARTRSMAIAALAASALIFTPSAAYAHDGHTSTAVASSSRFRNELGALPRIPD